MHSSLSSDSMCEGLSSHKRNWQASQESQWVRRRGQKKRSFSILATDDPFRLLTIHSKIFYLNIYNPKKIDCR